MINYSTLAFLIAWIFPTKQDRRQFRSFCREIDCRKVYTEISSRYIKTIERIKKYKNQKIRVLFLINELAKWKTQSLFDLMQKSEKFEPFVALTISDVQTKLSKEEKNNILKSNYNYFKERNIAVVFAYDFKRNEPIQLSKFEPDIVFYQQPYSLDEKQNIPAVSKYALTCYVPYYTPCYQNLSLDCQRSFHKSLYRFYVLNEEVENTYKQHLKNKFGMELNHIAGLGHTVLDRFRAKKGDFGDFVIYAPHWSICNDKNENNINIATFDWNGKLILEYAKKHPEINWVFKPHPTLKTALSRVGMSDKEIENYYSEWEKISTSCYTCDYVDLFQKSKAMITDCGSFLLEYFCTGKPLIHLISPNSQNMPYRYMQKIFDVFYEVKSEDDLYSAFDRILLQNNDYLKEKRLELLEQCSFTKNCAAENILKDLSEVLYNEV